MCEVGHTARAGYSARVSKRRLDTLLAERGLFETRSRAAAAVMAGDVRVGGRPARKPGELVADDADARGGRAPRRSSRAAGIKLANALDAFGLDPRGPAWRSTWAPPRAASPTACCSAAPPR